MSTFTQFKGSAVAALAQLDPDELIGNAMDDEDTAFWIYSSLPSFDIDEWAHKTIGQLLAEVTKPCTSSQNNPLKPR